MYDCLKTGKTVKTHVKVPFVRSGHILHKYTKLISLPCCLNGEASTLAASDFTFAGRLAFAGRFFCRAVSKLWADLRLLASRLMELGSRGLAPSVSVHAWVCVCACACMYVHMCTCMCEKGR